MEQPSRHQSVFTEALFQVCLHFQLMLFSSTVVVVIELIKNIIRYSLIIGDTNSEREDN